MPIATSRLEAIEADLDARAIAHWRVGRVEAGAPGAKSYGFVEITPERQRQVLYLRYRADLPFEDIGEVLGISASAARSRARSSSMPPAVASSSRPTACSRPASRATWTTTVAPPRSTRRRRSR